MRLLLAQLNIYIVKFVKLLRYRFLIIYIAIFLIPFFLGGPQIVVGSVVNALLVYSAIVYKTKKLFPVIFLPSLAVLLRGVLFGPFTVFLVYILPVIWLGNYCLLSSIRIFNNKKFPYWMIVSLSSLIKSAVMFAPVCALVYYSVLPKIFLTSMGLIQFTTALIGSAIVFGFKYNIIKRKF